MAATVFVILLAIVAVRIPDPPRWPRIPSAIRRGSRTDVSHLAWSFSGRDGRASSHIVTRLRAVAERRLRLHGIHPGNQHAVRDALGESAASLLTSPPDRPPTRREIDHCLDALESIGTVPRIPAWRADSYAPSPTPR